MTLKGSSKRLKVNTLLLLFIILQRHIRRVRHIRLSRFFTLHEINAHEKKLKGADVTLKSMEELCLVPPQAVRHYESLHCPAELLRCGSHLTPNAEVEHLSAGLDKRSLFNDGKVKIPTQGLFG